MKVRKIGVLVLILALLLTCVGCSGILEAFESQSMRQDTEAMLEAILANDGDSAYAIVENVCEEKDFNAVFDSLKDMLSGVEQYELQILSAYQNTNMSINDKSTTSTASYKMTTNTDTFEVEVQEVDTVEGLYSFYITPYEKTDYYSVGELGNMTGASVFQWGILLLNVVVIGVVVFTTVDCVRQKIRRKALWLVVILLGMVTVGATFAATSLNFNFTIGWLFAYSAFITYGGGTNVFRLMLPIGAIVYWIVRRTLLKKAAYINAVPVAVPTVQPDVPPDIAPSALPDTEENA